MSVYSQFMFERALSVWQIVSDVKQSLEKEYRTVVVEGEISNFSRSGNGHYYFTLSDEKASLNACLFKMDAYKNLKVNSLKDGDKIQCMGPLTVYLRRGQFQLVVKHFQLLGTGDLKEKYEQLKRKLAAEGIFDISIKKKIPLFPKRIAVLSAKQGAAISDFIKVYLRRSSAEIVLVPSIVQGEKAPSSLIKGLKLILAVKKKFDVVVLTRGGGSLEDLWAFNDEQLAKFIYSFPLPIISAVGHESDYVISDYVADLRCETPTAAAEVLSSGTRQIVRKLDNLKKDMLTASKHIFMVRNMTLNKHSPKSILKNIWSIILNYQRHLDQFKIGSRGLELISLLEEGMRLEEQKKGLCLGISLLYDGHRERLQRTQTILSALDPKAVLNRGYTYLLDDSNKVITNKQDFKQLEKGRSFGIKFKDGMGKAARL